MATNASSTGGGNQIVISKKYEGMFPFSGLKFYSYRAARTVGLDDFKLTCFRFFTFLNMIGLCSRKHLV